MITGPRRCSSATGSISVAAGTARSRRPASERGADDRQLVAELEATLASSQDRPRFATWDLDFLATYIVNNHHAYVRQAVGPLQAHTRKVADVHGDHHPEVREIAQRFDLVVADLTAHMAKEERMLFPYISRLAAAARGGEVPVAPFGTIANPIGMMEMEHRSAGDQMAAIETAQHRVRPAGRRVHDLHGDLPGAAGVRGGPAPARPPREQHPLPAGARPRAPAAAEVTPTGALGRRPPYIRRAFTRRFSSESL